MVMNITIQEFSLPYKIITKVESSMFYFPIFLLVRFWILSRNGYLSPVKVHIFWESRKHLKKKIHSFYTTYLKMCLNLRTKIENCFELVLSSLTEKFTLLQPGMKITRPIALKKLERPKFLRDAHQKWCLVAVKKTSFLEGISSKFQPFLFR